MFFSDNILSKKGALAKIWLAAHWERKLSKSQLVHTDISGSVDAILNQKGTEEQAPIALRLSGQLLLGCARIYSKQTKYLLEDCGEALIKIKMSFKTVNVVDLHFPDEQAEIQDNAANIGDAFSELDIGIFDPTIDKGTLQHVSKPADITIPESQGSSYYQLADTHQQDDHILDDLGYRDPLEDAPLEEEADHLMIQNQHDMDIDAVPAEDSIEVELGRDPVAELPFTPNRRNSISSAASSQRNSSQLRGRISLLEDFSFANERYDQDEKTPRLFFEEEKENMPLVEVEATAKKPSFLDSLLDAPTIDPSTTERKGKAPKALSAASKKPVNKKRRLVDDVLEIPSKVLQANLKNTAEICRSHMTLAPATRHDQALQDMENKDAAWWLRNVPWCDFGSQFDNILPYRWIEPPKQMSVTPVIPPAAEPEFSRHIPPTSENLPINDESALLDDPNIDPTMDSAIFHDILGNQNSFEAPPDFEPVQEDSFANMNAPSMDQRAVSVSPSRQRTSPRKDLLTNPKIPADLQPGLSAQADLGDEDDEIAAEMESGFSKSTMRAVGSLRSHFASNSKVAFSEWTQGATRSQTVSRFFDVLVLSTKGVISVSQNHDASYTKTAKFEEIFVSPLPQFSERFDL